MIGYTGIDYEGPEGFRYMNPRNAQETQRSGVYYDQEKGMYVFANDPETGEEIPEEIHTAPAQSKHMGRNLTLGLLAVGGFFLLTR